MAEKLENFGPAILCASLTVKDKDFQSEKLS